MKPLQGQMSTNIFRSTYGSQDVLVLAHLELPRCFEKVSTHLSSDSFVRRKSFEEKLHQFFEGSSEARNVLSKHISRPARAAKNTGEAFLCTEEVVCLA